MARFARDTVFIVQERVKELEISLGPGTADLGIRIGLHSGDGKFRITSYSQQTKKHHVFTV